jgi:hypothetical protein
VPAPADERAEARNFLAGRDKCTSETLVLRCEELDLGLELCKPCLFPLAALERG